MSGLEKWSQLCVIWVMKDLSCIVLLCILANHPLCLLFVFDSYHFCPLLCSFWMKYSLAISNFLKEISSLSHSLVSLFLVINHWGKFSYICLPLFGILHSNGFLFLFLLCLSHFCFPQVFVRPLQAAILPLCTSFSWRWSWLLPPVQCHELPSIVLQVLC